MNLASDGLEPSLSPRPGPSFVAANSVLPPLHRSGIPACKTKNAIKPHFFRFGLTKALVFRAFRIRIFFLCDSIRRVKTQFKAGSGIAKSAQISPAIPPNHRRIAASPLKRAFSACRIERFQWVRHGASPLPAHKKPLFLGSWRQGICAPGSVPTFTRYTFRIRIRAIRIRIRIHGHTG